MRQRKANRTSRLEHVEGDKRARERRCWNEVSGKTKYKLHVDDIQLSRVMSLDSLFSASQMISFSFLSLIQCLKDDTYFERLEGLELNLTFRAVAISVKF